MVFVNTSKLAIAPAVTGSFVISQEMKNVSAVPIIRQVKAFKADLRFVTFMKATPYFLCPTYL